MERKIYVLQLHNFEKIRKQIRKPIRHLRKLSRMQTGRRSRQVYVGHLLRMFEKRDV